MVCRLVAGRVVDNDDLVPRGRSTQAVHDFADRRAFGLNFERHLPEVVELPGRKVRKGDKVRVLPPRGKATKKPDERLWRVVGMDRSVRAAKLELLDPSASSEGATPQKSYFA